MDAHHLELLGTNDAPSEIIANELRDLILRPTKELEETEEEIRRVSTLLEQLKEKSNKVQDLLKHYNTILSPARKIPSDVLHEIFFHCLPTNRNPIMTASEAPMVLARVCRTWRAIALTSPRIWARIHITIPAEYPVNPSGLPMDITSQATYQTYFQMMQIRCKAITEWLSRSGTCPLSISVLHLSLGPGRFVEDVEQAKDDPVTKQLFDTILPFISRCKSLELTMPLDVYEMVEKMVNIDMIQLLQRLRLSIFVRGHPLPLEYCKSVMFFNAPNLHMLSYSGWEFGVTAPNAWHNLTFLCCHSSISHVRAADLFTKCQNLRQAKLCIINSPGDESLLSQIPSVTVPHLESLALSEAQYHGEFSTKLYECVRLPALEWFDYYCPPLYHDDMETVPATPVLSLFESSREIKKLICEPRGFSNRDLLQIFRLSTSLTHLVYGPHWQEPMSPNFFNHSFAETPGTFNLNHLTIDNDKHDSYPSIEQEILLPNLEKLEAYSISTLTDEELLRFIKSRMNSDSPNGVAVLKFVRVSFNRPMQTDISEEVHRMAKLAGVEFKLDLRYASLAPKVNDPLSSSFGLSEDGCSWTLPDTINEIRPSIY